ncbi:MAG: flagellar biosynthesis protein FlhB [Oscillospiraceae bacterium]
MAGEKSEKATAKRKQDERKKGNIFQSKEVVIIFSILSMFFLLQTSLPRVTKSMGQAMTYFFSLGAFTDSLTDSNLNKMFIDSFMYFVTMALPFLLASAVIVVVFTGIQTKMLVSFKNLSFKYNRIDPLKGIKKMVSLRGLVELTKSLIKISILIYIVYINISKNIHRIPQFIDMSITDSFMVWSDIIMGIVYNVVAVFVVIAGLDYLYQWWDYEKNLRMTKQEIKEEYKQMEGDPQVKGKIKDMQRERANNRMMQSVPTADVIIRNPTHYAVAIKYNHDIDTAPTVVAKGADYIALKIIKIAEENEIATIENKPLARGLFESVELDEFIPEQFYQPVAEVLAIVYNMKKKELN